MLLKTTRTRTTPLAMLLTLSASLCTSAVAQTYGDDYGDGRYGRVRYEENGITIRRASAGQQDAGGANAPIYPGDRILTSSRQRAEVQLSGGTLVRVDEMSEVTFQALPDPYAAYPDSTVLQISVGTIQVTSALSSQEEFRIDTPSGSIYLLGDGDFRVEVAFDGRTRVSSRRGVVEVSSAGGSVLVRGGTLTDVYAGSVPADPTPFNTLVADSFDRWVAERDVLYDNAYAADRGVAAQAYGELPEEVRPYSAELAAYGDWHHSDEYGYVWAPSGMGSEWRPYSSGYWDYGPNGYFWVSYEPWGWAPYRYGRWAFVGGVGWAWAPGSVFSGGWVVWSWGGAYVGWSALGFYGGPAFFGGPVFFGYYSPYCWSFVPYHGFHHRHYSYYGVDEVGHDLVDSAIVTRPPDISPQRLASSSEMRKVAHRQASQDAMPRELPSKGQEASDSGFRSLESQAASSRDETRESGAETWEPTAPRRTTGWTRPAPRVTPSGGPQVQFDRGPAIGGTQLSSPAPRRMTNTGPGPRPKSLQPSVPRPSQRPDARTAAPRRSTQDRRDIYRRLSTPRAPEKRPTSGTAGKTPTRSSPSSKAGSGARSSGSRKSPSSAGPSRSGRSRSSSAGRSRSGSSGRSGTSRSRSGSSRSSRRPNGGGKQ